MTSLFVDQWLYRWTQKGLTTVDTKKQLEQMKTIGIYFSAAWCGKLIDLHLFFY
jgi:hypothetical protein